MRCRKIISDALSVGKFGMDAIAWSQNLTADNAQARGARLVSREELFRSTDILTTHLVLSQRTKGLVGPAELHAMKPSARLINTSRGAIVDPTIICLCAPLSSSPAGTI
jgi:phosphoglycerate dehydrogenase-like enzyme